MNLRFSEYSHISFPSKCLMAFVAFSFFLLVAGNNSDAEAKNLTSQLTSMSTSAIQPPPAPNPILNGAQSISNNDEILSINDRLVNSSSLSSSAIAEEKDVAPLTDTSTLYDSTKNKRNAEPVEQFPFFIPLSTNVPESKSSEVVEMDTTQNTESTTAADIMNIPNETSKAPSESILSVGFSLAHLEPICSSKNYLGCIEAVSEASLRNKLALAALVLAMTIFRNLEPRFQPHMVHILALFGLFFTAKRFNEDSVYWGIGILVALAISAHHMAGSPTLREMLKIVPIITHYIKE